ncbi:MAG: ADP-ribosylglycohydrolase family protein [Thermoanaerobacteraceae bacterium]|nr:ADP-ribosylglycohydrolase family protein [Thermoanaerobacteraceae bacterium]
MLGAIIGDIVGSRFEFNNHRNKDFDLFAKGCFVTDDSIMTLAVAKAIMETEKSIEPPIGGYASNSDYLQLLGKLTVKYMQEIGRKYPDCGYGGMFARWVFSDNPEPYNSFGNGAAMRISPAGFAARTESEATSLAEAITSVTHNHEEGIKGAEAVSVAVYMARRGFLKSEIRDRISKDYYPLDFTIDEIRPTYQFNEKCQETVPQAIEAFLESKSFEDAIRIAISLGGDSDTIAAITGAIAEAYYGVPDGIRDKALSYLDDELRAIYDEWEAFIGKDVSRFNLLTKYIGRLSPTVSTVGDYMHEPPYETLFHEFYDEFMHFIEANYPQYCEDGVFYTSILRDKNFSEAEVAEGNVDALDALTVLAIIHRELISGCHWNYNEIDSFKEAKFVKWLKRLKDIDWQETPKKLSEVYFEIGGYGGYDIYHLLFTDKRAFLFSGKFLPEAQSQKRYSVRETEQLIADWNSIHTEYWKSEYPQEGDMIICDGTQWSLFVRYEGSRGLMYGGDNTYPENWEALLALFGIEYDDEDDDYDDGEKPGRKPGEVIYCNVSFSEDGSTYYYQTEDESIKVGDRVIVPVGSDYAERIAIVEGIEYFEPTKVPFPLDKIKYIIGKRPDKEDRTL